jgi:hypothetical protein
MSSNYPVKNLFLNRLPGLIRIENGYGPGRWWQYSLGILIQAYREFEDRVGIIGSSRGAKTAQVKEAIMHLPETFSAGDLSRACPGVSRPMIRVILESLRREGKLEVLGTGRGATWRKRANI